MVISHTISLQFKPPAAAHIRLLLHAAAHSCAGIGPDRMVRDGNKDGQTQGFQHNIWLPSKKWKYRSRGFVMTLTASQCDNSVAPASPPDPKPRPRTVAQMGRVKPSQIEIQSKLPERRACKKRPAGTAFIGICLVPRAAWGVVVDCYLNSQHLF